jgi:hypothetical protein
MGRSLPATRLPRARRNEVLLAHAVESAIVRAQPATPPDPAEDELASAEADVLEVLSSSTAEAAGDGAIADMTAGLPPIALPIVFLDGLEVTQEVQDLQHSVPLVARKATIVRAYLRYAPSQVNIRGELLVARTPVGPWQPIASLGTAQLAPSRSGSGLARLQSRRANLNYSLNFLLPADLTHAGTVWMRMGVVRRATGSVLPSLAGLVIRSFKFHAAAPLRLRLVRLRYSMGSPPVIYEASATDVSLIGSWLRRAYPIAELNMTTTTATAVPTPPFGAAQINAQLAALRAVDVSTGTDARTHFYGLVADGGFFMRGLATGIPQTPTPSTVAAGPTGSSTFGWDTDGSYGDWYGGHELGHTFGRFHAEFCGAVGGAPYPFPDGQLSGTDGAFVGIDVGDGALGLPLRVMRGTTSHDVMSYCSNEWLSSFTFSGIYDRLVAEDALPAGVGGSLVGLGALAAGSQDAAVQVVAALNLTRREGNITSVLPVALDVTQPMAAPAADRVSVRTRDGSGTVLDERMVAFQRSVCEQPDDDVTGIVDVIMPPIPGAAVVELLLDGQVLDSYPVGGEATEVGPLLRSDAAIAGPGGGAGIDLRWDVPDAPASQRYVIQASDDGGATWRTLAAGLTEPAITVHPGDFAGAREVSVRVLATTGFGSTVVRTDTVALG